LLIVVAIYIIIKTISWYLYLSLIDLY
jgi:hypothetical protein